MIRKGIMVVAGVWVRPDMDFDVAESMKRHRLSGNVDHKSDCYIINIKTIVFRLKL